MSTIKYLLDENVNPGLRIALHKNWPEMVLWRVGDPGVPQDGTLDPKILLWCEANDFSLVTNNRASMPVHLADHLAAGRHVPGIFIINAGMTMGQTAEELAIIWGASEAEEYLDILNFLPLS